MVGSREVALSHQCARRLSGASVIESAIGGVESYLDLRATLVQIYGIEGQAEVFRAQIKLVSRKKGESLTDLEIEIRRLMVMTLPGP